MTPPTTEYQRHKFSCANSHLYPSTLLRRPRPHEVHVLKNHANYLLDNEDRLFNDDSEEHLVEIFEIHAERIIKLKANQFRTCDTQFQHMQQEANQWDIRHVFLQSSDSRSPLDCSSDMLKSCFTFHQVEASFLDSVYTFGDQDKPLDLCLAHFRSSHTMDLAERDLIAIPELHLSGREFRVSYLLRSMEFSGNTESTWKWNLRQTAVYHSFDAETGKSFWCNIKANDNFKTRIKDSASYLDLDQPALMQEHRVHRLFTAALSTHLIYLHWCDENWRWCINDMDVAIGALLDQARLTSINDLQLTAPAYVELQIRKVTLNSTRTYGNPPPAGLVRDSSRGSAYILHKFAMLLRKVFSPRQLFGRDLGLDLGKSNNLPDPTENPEVAPNRVRVSRPQALQIWSERIERLMLAVQLDITVLGEISAFYSGLTESLVSLHGSVWEEYDRDIRHFAKEIANISSGLETRKVQMQSLVLQLSEGQNLYGMLLQQVTAISAEVSAKRMETIGYKTAQETASMHIITIVTLIFLPGTFVATFFQSGVFWWKEAPEDMESTWSYRGDAFAFFSYLCFPLMIATLGIWFCVWFRMGRDRQQLGKEGL